MYNKICFLTYLSLFTSGIYSIIILQDTCINCIFSQPQTYTISINVFIQSKFLLLYIYSISNEVLHKDHFKELLRVEGPKASPPYWFLRAIRYTTTMPGKPRLARHSSNNINAKKINSGKIHFFKSRRSTVRMQDFCSWLKWYFTCINEFKIIL